MVIENLSYKNILKDINLEIGTGINYLKGNNGSGKSTLLDCISNINKDYSGNIAGNNNIVYLNQNLYFDYRLKAKDFVQFLLSIEGIRNYKQVFFNNIEKYGAQKRYEEIWEQPMGMLSGGQIAVLFFASITCLDREWYIFDEPFAGVDEIGIKFMSEIISDLQREGKGIIITSHESIAFNNLDNVNVIELVDGSIVKSGR